MSSSSHRLTADEVERGLLEAKSTASFRKKVSDEFMTFEDAKMLLTLTASAPETVEEWLERIHRLEEVSEEKGAYIPLSTFTEKTLVCPECDHEYTDPDQSSTFRKLNFWDFRKARGQYLDHMLIDFNARVNSISDIGRMAVFNDDDLLYSPFYDFNPQSLIYAFQNRREGILATVSGTMGVGKTDFTLTIVQELLACPKPTFNVITNIPLTEKTLASHEGRLFYRDTMRGLLRCLCERVLGDTGRHSVVPLDETAMFFSRREPAKKTNVLLEKFIRLIRKYNASLLFIDQQRDGLPGAALELRTVMYHKTDLTKVHYSSSLGSRKYNHHLNHIPKTRLGYYTYKIGSFNPNVDLAALFDHIDKMEKNGVDPVHATLIFLDELEARTPERDPFEKRVLDYIKDNPGCTQKQLLIGVGLEFNHNNEMTISRVATKMEKDRLIDRGRVGSTNRLYICEVVSNKNIGIGNTDTGPVPEDRSDHVSVK